MIEHQLQNIPRGLQELYTQILNTMIGNLNEWELQVVQQLFLWIDINDYARAHQWESLSLRSLEMALQHVSMGEPVHDSIPLTRKLGSHMVDVFAEGDGSVTVDLIHHTARQYIKWSSTAPSARLPVTLVPRRLRELHCGATAAWYHSQHRQAKYDLIALRGARDRSGGILYFEMAYALWGAFKLTEIPVMLAEEETSRLVELCDSLTKFLSGDLCLTWVEMAILINYAGSYPQLLENVDAAIVTSSEPTQNSHQSFEAFRENATSVLHGLCLCHLPDCPRAVLYRSFSGAHASL